MRANAVSRRLQELGVDEPLADALSTPGAIFTPGALFTPDGLLTPGSLFTPAAAVPKGDGGSNSGSYRRGHGQTYLPAGSDAHGSRLGDGLGGGPGQAASSRRRQRTIGVNRLLQQAGGSPGYSFDYDNPPPPPPPPPPLRLLGESV